MTVSIYLASSHRNEQMSDVLVALRKAGYKVYSPHESGFTWPELALKPIAEEKMKVYSQPAIQAAFGQNMRELDSANVVVGVEPLSIDAAFMLGWAGEKSYLLLYRGRPVLASLMCKHVASIQELLAKLAHDYPIRRNS